MNLKTKDYSIFKYREDNRPLDQGHVKKLARSIQAQNMLDLRPIEVDGEMQVIDGQHRLEAAKSLGVEIHYKIVQDSRPSDIISLNIAKTWSPSDYFNYYLKNDHEHYVKLESYMRKNQITLKLALNILKGTSTDVMHDFKLGLFKFDGEASSETLDICHQTVDFIKKMNGFSTYTKNSRFWMAMVKLVNHADFTAEKWQQNLARLVHKFGPKASHKDYMEMLLNCYNWKNHSKIVEVD